MNSTRMPGASAPSRSASARPLTSGITTSVSSRSTPRGSLHRRAASSASVDGEHRVAVGLEHQPHELAHAGVVLDDHDRLGAALGVAARVAGGAALGAARSRPGR